MAGRPVDNEKRENNKRMLDAAIEGMQRMGIPVTKSNLARESGISRQSLNKGYLAEYVDSLGVIEKYTNAAFKEPDSIESLKREIEALKNENKQLRKKNADNNKSHKEELRKKDEIIDRLTEEVETLRGEKYLYRLRNSRVG